MTMARSSAEAVLIKLGGTLTGAITPFVRKHVDPLIAQGRRPHVFLDALAVEGYESAARETMVAWVKQHRDKLASLHVLFRSKLVAMGVAVANVALGGMVTGHSDERAFYRAVDAVLPAAR